MQKRKLLQAVFGIKDLFELAYWVLSSGGIGTIVGGIMNALGLSPATTIMFVVGAFLLALSFLPRVKGIRRLFGLATDRPETKLKAVLGMKVKNQTISLDWKSFDNCGFESCTFRWNGGPWQMRDCKISGTRRIETQNQTALLTIETLRIFGFLEPGFAASWKRLPKEYFNLMQ